VLTSPSPSPAVCPQCTSPTGRFDRFCGICGAHLARLRWQPPGIAAWQEGNGQLAVTEGATAARVAFENDGVVSLALILDDRSLDALPDWIDLDALRGQELLLAPKAQLSLEVPLRGEALRSRAELDLSELQRHEAMLSFLTSASDRPLELTLVLALQPWVQPAASLYRFLPIERLREGVVHEIQLHNAAAALAELDRIVIEDDPVAPPAGYVRIPGEHLLRRDIQLPLSLQAGEVWTHRLLLKATELPLPEDARGWFSTTVRYELLFNNERREVITRLSGAVGRGPTLELRGSASVTSKSPDVDTQHSFSFRNPGQLPVEVLAVEVLREHDGRQEPAPDPDWLVFKGLMAGDLVGPGEERSLVIGFQSGARPPDEFQQEWSSRQIIVRHDGWQEPAARHLKCQVTQKLGLAKEKTLGIDFGTSNSMACLMGQEQGYPLALEFFENREPFDYLASLIYFDDSAASDSEPFLYGEAAKNSANTEPANLVRSIKTVVSDGKRSEYHFLKSSPHGGFQDVRFKTQELLNLFIREIRSRAEKGVLHLSPKTRKKEGLIDRRALFRTAVFSHPVEMTESMKIALMQAAHRAGLNRDIQSPQEFFNERCVDEATAAVLAYVNKLLIDHSEGRGEYELKDLEKILCVDIGGGTTDLAAVAVKDMASYAGETTDKVTVELWCSNGDRKFAGDVLDQLLANEILNEIAQQSREKGSPVLIEEVMEAILSPSYSAYQLHFEEKAKSDPRRLGVESFDPYSVYSLAVNVLQAAEEAKRSFSSEAEVARTFTGSGWPRDLRSAATGGADVFKVSLKREVFEAIVRREIERRFHLISRVVKAADWEWPSITTLLLTGQSMRSPIIRRPIIEYVQSQMGEEAAKGLVVVEPHEGSASGNGFDPKACVAIGAALWGISRTEEDAWLTISRPYLEQLTFDLTTRGPGRYKRIPGLVKGASLPAEGVVEFPVPRQNLTIYRDREEFVQFNNFKLTKRITIRVESLADYWVVVDGEDGEKCRGEMVS
jgi:molecular chaperone DnaK (HSP70)